MCWAVMSRCTVYCMLSM